MPRSDRLKDNDGKLNLIGARVKQRRRELKLTQDDLQGRLSYATNGQWAIAGQEVLNIERGARTVIDLELVALADALECSPHWLLGRAESQA